MGSLEAGRALERGRAQAGCEATILSCPRPSGSGPTWPRTPCCSVAPKERGSISVLLTEVFSLTRDRFEIVGCFGPKLFLEAGV